MDTTRRRSRRIRDNASTVGWGLGLLFGLLWPVGVLTGWYWLCLPLLVWGSGRAVLLLGRLVRRRPAPRR